MTDPNDYRLNPTSPIHEYRLSPMSLMYGFTPHWNIIMKWAVHWHGIHSLKNYVWISWTSQYHMIHLLAHSYLLSMRRKRTSTYIYHLGHVMPLVLFMVRFSEPFFDTEKSAPVSKTFICKPKSFFTVWLTIQTSTIFRQSLCETSFDDSPKEI